MNETVATAVAAVGPWALAFSVVGLFRAQRAWDRWCRTPYPEPRHRRHHRRPPNRPETHPDHLRALATFIGNDEWAAGKITEYANHVDAEAEAAIPRLPCGHPRSKPPHIVGDGDFEAFREACEECGAVVPDAIDIERMGQ